MRVKPYKGKFVFRKRANRVNDMFLSAITPDRTKLIQEAKEFEELIKTRRSAQHVGEGKCEGDDQRTIRL